MIRVEEFYDQLSSKYSELIIKCVPRYPELMDNMFRYLPSDFQPKRILDLGCGTGNLTELMLKTFPEAEIDALDISENILKESRKRFSQIPNIRYIQADFKSLHLAPGSYDLVMSTIAIHHIEDYHKSKLYKEVYQALTDKGIFIFADQTRGITDEIYHKNISSWKNEAFKLGSTQENWDMWMKHQDAHDFHTPVPWHLQELANAGFTETDLLWKYLLWAVIWARK
ncbi:class I SAM-dependent methyltransferase [Daejeonella lutea]|uniref:tRNA (Cmo5U34)-methyltransferase n=1 Tax=Daejeonella lutea TaxID=572036 RepID=A0A1T5BZ54_9SPHI|nr:class I SAM-dependent methyltransferase [Daejeonella lutea]SKB52421.1 tRNA (cmo5U34)-methyltransferase [Daejeonella lutea]